MVGADGAIHLDEMGGSMAGAMAGQPIVIQQPPELVPPGFDGTRSRGGGPWSGAMVPSPAMSSVLVGPTPMSSYVHGIAPNSQRTVRHSIYGEFLFLHPTGGDVAHGQQQSGMGGPGAMPLGRIGAADQHYEPGVRIGGDWAVSETTSLAASYAWFESNARQRLEAPVGGSVRSLVHHPGAALPASPGPVDARAVINFQLADADYRALLIHTNHYWLNGSLGLRWGRLQQEFGQVGTFGLDPGDAIVTQADVDFDGGGPKFGIDGGRAVGKRGLALYGRIGVTPMAGQFHAAYRLTNDSADALLAEALWSDDRIVTLLDYEVGVAWTAPQRRWRVAAGYTASFWYNVLSTSDFIHSVQADQYGHASRTISFDGLTARIERMW